MRRQPFTDALNHLPRKVLFHVRVRTKVYGLRELQRLAITAFIAAGDQFFVVRPHIIQRNGWESDQHSKGVQRASFSVSLRDSALQIHSPQKVAFKPPCLESELHL